MPVTMRDFEAAVAKVQVRPEPPILSCLSYVRMRSSRRSEMFWLRWGCAVVGLGGGPAEAHAMEGRVRRQLTVCA